jgi:hypothetical protein
MILLAESTSGGETSLLFEKSEFEKIEEVPFNARVELYYSVNFKTFCLSVIWERKKTLYICLAF